MSFRRPRPRPRLRVCGGAGSGGTVYALSEATGELAWLDSVENGDQSSPAVDANNSTSPMRDSRTTTSIRSRALKWHYDATGIEGGGGRTPVLSNATCLPATGRPPTCAVSHNGADAGAFSSTAAPAIGGGQAYMVQNRRPHAVSDSGMGAARGRSLRWGLDAAPLVSATHLRRFSSETCTAIDSSGIGVCRRMPGADRRARRQNQTPLSGLAAADGMLFVPAGSTLIAYAGRTRGAGHPRADRARRSRAPLTSASRSVRMSGAGARSRPGTPTSGSAAMPADRTATRSRSDREAYRPVSADLGSTLEVSVAAMNGSGTSSPVTSGPSEPVAMAPAYAPPVNWPWAPPSIAGSAVQGDTLTASPANGVTSRPLQLSCAVCVTTTARVVDEPTRPRTPTSSKPAISGSDSSAGHGGQRRRQLDRDLGADPDGDDVRPPVSRPPRSTARRKWERR